MSDGERILITGATGYIGGRLISHLLEARYSVRAMVRDPNRLRGRPWYDQVELVKGDVLKPETLPAALQGITIAYYLIHSMGGGKDFEERDKQAANNFQQAANAAGVQRIIYLGGLGEAEAELSQHLRSRHQTGDVLRLGQTKVTEFRAAVIVGSGSLSFEMIRYLTERVPIMICPQWVYTRVQPIAIRNVLQYLVAAIETPASAGQIIDIGGADVLTYGDMMKIYAQVRGLWRILLPVPVLTPRLSSYWVHLVTPIPSKIAQPLIEGLRSEVVVRNDRAYRLFPQIQPMDYRTAVARALAKLNAQEVETAWSGALTSSQGDREPVILGDQEGMLLEKRQRVVQASAAAVYQAFSRLGGTQGWLYFDWAWQIRGLLDRMVGGVGLRRGRRHPMELRPGDALDFWRVEAVDLNHSLRLRAEMKVPGRAWLQFEANRESDTQTCLVQTAYFAPKGLWGLLYWYLLYPIHALIFSGLIDALKEQAEVRPSAGYVAAIEDEA